MSIKSIYKKIKENPKNVSFEDIHKLMVAGGFQYRNRKSSHYVYTHPDLEGIDNCVTIPFNRPVKTVYIKRAIQLFDLANPDFDKE